MNPLAHILGPLTLSRPPAGSPGVGSPVPSDVTGLYVWLEADAISGVSDGDRVASWGDLSGLGHTPTATGSPRPWYRAHGGPVTLAVPAGLPAVEFSPDDATGPNALTFPSGVFTGLGAAEVFCVLKLGEDPPSRGQGLWHFGASGLASHYTFAGTIYDDFGSAGRYTVGDPSASLTDWQVYGVSASSAGWDSRVSGTSMYSTGTNTVSWVDPAHLGANYSSGAFGYHFRGWMYMFLVFDHILTTGDRTIIHNYINSKTGVTIA